MNCDADLVVFDPNTICDKADYVNFRARCEGLKYVLVNGIMVVEDAVFHGNKQGKVLRK